MIKLSEFIKSKENIYITEDLQLTRNISFTNEK
jgi:hypothetical protein